jgi:hypothetical protein
VVAVLALAPFAWFLVRDAFGVVTDVLAVVLPVLVVVVAVLAAILGIRRRRWLVLSASTLAMGIVATVSPWLPDPTGPVAPGRAVTVAAANIGAGELDGAAELIGLGADVLVISEIGEPLTARLEQAYPYEVHEWNGPAIGVFSKLPFDVLGKPGPDLPGVLLRVHGPGGPFVLNALHVPRPWFDADPSAYQATVAEHHRLIEQVAARAAAEQLPFVVAGDLNTTDRSRDYRILVDHGRRSDAMLDGWAAPTQIGRWSVLFVRIDHLLVTRGWCSEGARQYPVPASDHRGIMAAIGPCAGR